MVAAVVPEAFKLLVLRTCASGMGAKGRAEAFRLGGAGTDRTRSW